MRSLLLASTVLLAGVFAIPTPSADPIRTLPPVWQFDIADLKGPGCPDLHSDRAHKTRHNYGQNTVDGTEIYYNVFAYPYMNVSIPEGETSASIWCETTVKYIEYDSWSSKNPGFAADYRIRPHKNGSLAGAIYDLEEGVKAEWKFTYDTPSDKKIVDTMSISGPLKNKYQSDDFLYTQNLSPEQWKSPECGGTMIKFRVELTVTADKPGKKGIATSETIKGTNGDSWNYGTWLGISFDWEKCNA